MARLYIFLLFAILCNCQVEKQLQFVRKAANDWIQCYIEGGDEASVCLEERTSRGIHEITSMLKSDVFQYSMETKRLGKKIEDGEEKYSPEESEEIQKLTKESATLTKRIRSRSTKSRGLVDDMSDLFTYGVAKFIGDYTPDKEETENEDDDDHTEVSRGHKKKYLKKQNKHLKIILLMMLFKNKVKMFMQKIQTMIQLKFLGIAVVNLLINVARLWLEIKKKKPHKVVYYENAHHQHHYDHEHVHDDSSSSHHHPSHSHYSHHEEDYGGGPWPWSRAYVEPEQNLKSNLQAHEIAYHKQKPSR